MPYIAQWYCRASLRLEASMHFILVVLGQRRLLCLGKAPCCRQQDKASKRKIQRDDSCCRSGSVLFFLLITWLFQSSWVGWRFSWMFLCPPLCYRRLMLKRSSRGPTEMRGSWAHKGITARSRAKPVALEKGVRGGSDGGTCRNGWNEKKGVGAATIPCKDRVRQRREDLGERLPKWEAQRSESKKVSKEKGSSFAYRRALFCRCLLRADHVLARTVARVWSPLLS